MADKKHTEGQGDGGVFDEHEVQDTHEALDTELVGDDDTPDECRRKYASPRALQCAYRTSGGAGETDGPIVASDLWASVICVWTSCWLVVFHSLAEASVGDFLGSACFLRHSLDEDRQIGFS